MITGWFKTKEDEWYYLNKEDGTMLSNQWFKDNDKWYYATDSGIVAKDVYVRDEKGYCWLGCDGAWDGQYVSSPDLNVINS